MIFKDYLLSKGFGPSTIKNYLSTFKRITDLFARRSKETQDLQYDDIIQFVKRRRTRVSVRTINGELKVLKHYFDYLIIEGLRYDNPAKNILVQREKKNTLYAPIPKNTLIELYKNFPNESAIEVRDKVILGLYIFQGLTTNEISNINTFNVDLDLCEIIVPEARRNAGRTLHIESLQLRSFIKYLEGCREEVNPNEPQRLIVSTGSSRSILNVTTKLFKKVSKSYPEIESWLHIRASVIVNELTDANLRQCQYKFGFRHIDSIEKYLQNNVEDLREELDRCFGI